MPRDFTKIIAWQKGNELVIYLYGILRQYPKSEEYILVQQMKRCAISCPANIAEGSSRKGKVDYLHFLNIAEASMAELKYYVILSRDLGYINETLKEDALIKIDEVLKLLSGLTKAMKFEAY